MARPGWKGDYIVQHPEDPAKDPPRIIRVYPKGHAKYPAGTTRLFDQGPEDVSAEDWEERPAV
jgi:hypothetical protein